MHSSTVGWDDASPEPRKTPSIAPRSSPAITSTTNRARCFSGSHSSTEGGIRKPVSRSIGRKLLMREKSGEQRKRIVTAQVSRPTQLIEKHRVVIRDQSKTEANLPVLAQSATRFVSTYGVQVNNFNALSPRTLPGQLRHPDMPTTPCVENGRF